MRDAEIENVLGDGRFGFAVATHDQGVIATIVPKHGAAHMPPGRGRWEVQEIDHEKDTFGHEIESGDVDGDGAVEFYATLSEPNRLDGSEQSGKVMRYLPAKGERVEVADLGDRHATEILVRDIDGDGRDELYVASDDQGEIRRYVWYDGRFEKEVIHTRKPVGSAFTWNLMPVPVELVQ